MLSTASSSYVDARVQPGRRYEYHLAAVRADGVVARSHVVSVTVPAAELTLEGVFPNPFNPSTTIQFVVPADGTPVSLAVYDTQGKLVRQLFRDRPYGAGEQEVEWDGTNDGGQRAASGVYFVVLSDPSTMVSRKVMVLK